MKKQCNAVTHAANDTLPSEVIVMILNMNGDACVLAFTNRRYYGVYCAHVTRIAYTNPIRFNRLGADNNLAVLTSRPARPVNMHYKAWGPTIREREHIDIINDIIAQCPRLFSMHLKYSGFEPTGLNDDWVFLTGGHFDLIVKKEAPLESFDRVELRIIANGKSYYDTEAGKKYLFEHKNKALELL